MEAIYKIVCPLVSCEQYLNFPSFVKEWTAMPENLDSEQRNRLWEHRLHVEIQMYGRVTLFLAIETVLLAIVGIVYSKPGLSLLVVKAIVFLGLCLTIIWGYLQDSIKQVFYAVDTRALANLPEYKATVDATKKARWPLILLKGPTPQILAYVIPALFALLWIFLLFFL
jgi:hypothetical protein